MNEKSFKFTNGKDDNEMLDLKEIFEEEFEGDFDFSNVFSDDKSGRGQTSSDHQNSKSEGTLMERRLKNREHAKKSRARKKVMYDALQKRLTKLRNDNLLLRRVIMERIPQATAILNACTSVQSHFLDDLQMKMDEEEGITTKNTIPAATDPPVRVLTESDYRLMQSLIISQKNFVITDPCLPDNPIVYASQGFLKLTGYARDAVVGRNCRFLQGPGTDPAAIDMIRMGLKEGRDISVCLLNYKADGTPFWNQFFLAPLKDSADNVVNYVGVQCEVNNLPIETLKERVKKLPILP